MRYILLIVILLVGCSIAPPVVCDMDGWTIIRAHPSYYADICEGRNGCAVMGWKIIYCPPGSGGEIICGHELRHVCEGGFHE